MKALCLISHTIPLGLGRFEAYEQGLVYDVENPVEPLWEKIPEEAAAGGDPVPALEKKKSGKSRIKADPADGDMKPLIHLVRTNDEEGGNKL